MASDPRIRPVELNLDRRKHLRVRWADGHEGTIPLVRLRRACPCAECTQKRAEQDSNPLRVIQPEPNLLEMVTVDTAELVGHYGLRIRWNDGHEAGIYDFETLRRLSQ